MFSGFLRQSTATSVKVGPARDATDAGATEEALAPLTVKASKAGGALAALGDTGAHDADGFYDVDVTAGETDTAGILLLTATVAGVRPITHVFVVLPQDLYDFLTASGFLTALLELANQIEGAFSLKGAISVLMASQAGETTGMDTGTPAIKAAGDPNTTRISGTGDAWGNRSGITITPES